MIVFDSCICWHVWKCCPDVLNWLKTINWILYSKWHIVSECICTHFLLKIWLRKQLKLNHNVFFNMQWHQCEFKVSGFNINRSFWRLSWLTGKLCFFCFIYLFLNNKTLIRHFQIIKNRSVQFLDKSCVSSFLGVSFLFTVSLHFPELGITLLPQSEAL